MFLPKFVRAMGLAVVALAPVVGASDARAQANVPTFDVTPSCRAAMIASGMRDSMQACLASEQRAREQLIQQWPQFTRRDRQRCLQESQMGGEPTYTEYVTCLEMARDARQLPAEPGAEALGTRNSPASTTGVGTPPAQRHRAR